MAAFSAKALCLGCVFAALLAAPKVSARVPMRYLEQARAVLQEVGAGEAVAQAGAFRFGGERLAQADGVPPPAPPRAAPAAAPPAHLPQATNVEDLLGRSGEVDGAGVYLLGYDRPGDGGGGALHWAATSEQAHDGVFVFRPAGREGAGRWLRAWESRRINVQQAGLIGDGEPIPGERIENLFDVAQERGLEIHFPAGRYNMEHFSQRAFHQELRISGENRESTVLFGGTGRFLVKNDLYLSDIAFEDWTGFFRRALFQIDNEEIAEGEATTEYVFIRNVRARRMRGFIVKRDANPVTLQRLEITGCVFTDMHGRGPIVISANVESALIADNYIRDIIRRDPGGNRGILVFSNRHLVRNIVVRNNTVKNLHSTGRMDAIIISGEHVVIDGNLVEDVFRHVPEEGGELLTGRLTSLDTQAIYTKAQKGVFTNNIIAGGDFSHDDAAITLKGSEDSHSWTVTGNVVINRDNVRGQRALRSTGSAVISNNYFEGRVNLVMSPGHEGVAQRVYAVSNNFMTQLHRIGGGRQFAINVSNNVIYNPWGGACISGSSADPENYFIRNNTLITEGQRGSALSGVGAHGDMIVENNVIFTSAVGRDFLNNRAGYMRFANNVLRPFPGIEPSDEEKPRAVFRSEGDLDFVGNKWVAESVSGQGLAEFAAGRNLEVSGNEIDLNLPAPYDGRFLLFGGRRGRGLERVRFQDNSFRGAFVNDRFFQVSDRVHRLEIEGNYFEQVRRLVGLVGDGRVSSAVCRNNTFVNGLLRLDAGSSGAPDFGPYTEVVVEGNSGYRTESVGTASGVAPGAEVPHGLAIRPNVVLLTPMGGSPLQDARVARMAADTFSVEFSGGQEGSFSWQAQYRPAPPQAPAAPALQSPLEGAAVAADELALAWENVDGSTLFQVQISREEGRFSETGAALNRFTAGALADGGALVREEFPGMLEAGGPYYWRVRAVGPSNSPWSEVGAFHLP